MIKKLGGQRLIRTWPRWPRWLHVYRGYNNVPHVDILSHARISAVRPIKLGDCIFFFKDDKAWIMLGKGLSLPLKENVLLTSRCSHCTLHQDRGKEQQACRYNRGQ